MTDETGAAGVLEKAKRAQGRPRSVENDRAIMSAVKTMLAEEGFEGLRFDALARVSGVSRPSIYRRWATKAELLNEVVYGNKWDIPADLVRNDLRRTIRNILENVTSYYSRPEMRAAVLGALASLPSTARAPCELAIEAEKETRGAVAQMVADAKAAGLMRPDVEPGALYDLMMGSVIYRTIFSYRRISGEIPEDLVDIIMDGLQAS